MLVTEGFSKEISKISKIRLVGSQAETAIFIFKTGRVAGKASFVDALKEGNNMKLSHIVNMLIRLI